MSRCSLEWTAMPVRSGPMRLPSAAVDVALGALVLEDDLAGLRIAFLLRCLHELLDDFHPVGVRQAAAFGKDCLRSFRDRRLGMGRERLPLIQR